MLGNQRSSYNPAFHGEFSYALLHILNHHHLRVNRESKPLLLDIATTMGQEFYIRDKAGTPLGWRDAPMGEFLSPVEFKCGVNAYGGDIVYKAILAEDQAFFNRYYPMLHEDEKDDLHYRMATSKDALPDVYSRYQQALVDSFTSPPRKTSRAAPHTTTTTPSSITDMTSLPRDNSDTKGTITKEDSQKLAQKSRSMFSIFGPDEHEISEVDDAHASKVTSDY